jgi:hypothetical protein
MIKDHENLRRGVRLILIPIAGISHGLVYIGRLNVLVLFITIFLIGSVLTAALNRKSGNRNIN